MALPPVPREHPFLLKESNKPSMPWMFWFEFIKNKLITPKADTVDDMINLPIGTVSYINTLGYYVKGDLGAGAYYWNSTSTATPDGGLIIAHVTLPTVGRFELIHNGIVSVLQFGAKGNDGADSWDDLAPLQACMDSMSAIGGAKVTIPSTGSDYLVSNILLIKGELTVEWLGGGSYIRASQIGDGGTVSTNADNQNVTFINPHVDGGGDSIITGGSGNNGIGGASNTGSVTVFGGHIKNCSRGNTDIRDGGKAFQFEGGNAQIEVYGTYIEDCFMALSTRRDVGTEPTLGGVHVIFDGIFAKNCEIMLFCQMANTSDNTGREYSISLDNFTCVDFGSNYTAGIFMFSRASNVKISNGTVSGTVTMDSIIRGRARKLRIDNVIVNQDATCLINIDPVATIYGSSLNYAPDASAMADNYYNVTATGTYDYVYNSDSLASDAQNLSGPPAVNSTYPNRFLQNSYFDIILSNDVGVELASSATAINNNTWLMLMLNNKVIYGKVGDIRSGYDSIGSDSSFVFATSGLNFASDLTTPSSILSEETITAEQLTSTDEILAANNIRINKDDGEIQLGNSINDFRMKWDGTGWVNTLAAGYFRIDNSGKMGLNAVPSLYVHLKGGASQIVGVTESTSSVASYMTFKHASLAESVVYHGAVGSNYAIYTNSLNRVQVDENGNVGINDITPTYKLDVNGNARIVSDFTTDGGRIKPPTRVTTTYTILVTDDQVFGNTDSAGFTATLPAGVEGQSFRIVNTGSSSNTLTLAPNGSEHLIGVNSNWTLADGESLIVTYNATDGWY